MNSTKDILLYECGSGGEFLIENNDLAMSESLYQTIYISLFGGNTKASTTGDERKNEERFDFWANSLIFATKPNKQMNSRTEFVLSNITLNSSGRLKLKSAVEEDLSFLKNIAVFSVNIVILNIDDISIEIFLKENQSKDPFVKFIWNNSKKEIINNITI